MHRHHGVMAGMSWRGALVERAEDLREFTDWVTDKANAGERVCFDTESHGLGIYTYGQGFVRLAQFGTTTEAYVIPVEHGTQFEAAVADALRKLPKLSGHDVIRHDGLVADKHLGVPLEECVPKMRDTMISSKLIDSRSVKHGGIGHGLKAQSSKYVWKGAPDTQEGLEAVFRSLKVGHTKEKNPVGWSHVPWNHPIYVVYAMFDVILGARLVEAHAREMKRLGVRPYLVPYEHRLSKITAVMSRAGMLVDRPYTESLYGDLDEEYERYMQVCRRYGVESVGSHKSVRAALLEVEKKPWDVFTDTGELSTSAEALLPMADLDEQWERIGAREPNMLADAVLRAKRATKWKVTYVDRFLNESILDGRVHPNIRTLEALTARMSITNPAVQTLPSGDAMIRRCLLAEEGHRMVSVDFSAVELRVLAALADVRLMKQAILRGDNLHSRTAALVFGENFTDAQRQLAKKINFGKVYGGGARTIRRQTGAPMEMVVKALKGYERAYPEVKEASDRWQREAFGQGMIVYTATNRRVHLDRDRTYAVVNYKCQSTARDLLGKALIRMDDAGLLPYLRLPIHDEVLASVPADEVQDVQREIERCMTMDFKGVPIVAEGKAGKRSWGSLYGAAE